MSREKILASGGVRAIFSPQGDRFTCRIELLPSGMVLLAVDEPTEAGSVSDVWPPSPPLQDVHLEERPDGLSLALMVGQAGTSHWSISCELDSQRDELAFDVACRIKEPATWLGSTYQLPPELEYQGDPAGGEIRTQGNTLARLSAESPAVIHWDPQRRILQLRPAKEAATPGTGQGEKYPQTIRWRYRLLAGSAVKSGGN